MNSKVKYPTEWRGLSFPAKRFELLGYLDEISTVALPADGQQTEFEIDDIFNFFFDDTNLADDERSSIGTILVDETEEKALRILTHRLDALFNEIGDAPTLAYLNHPNWSQVALEAKAVRALLAKSGEPAFGST